MKLVQTILFFALVNILLSSKAQNTLTASQLDSVRTKLQIILSTNCEINWRKAANSTSYLPIKIKSINITSDRIEFLTDTDKKNAHFYENLRVSKASGYPLVLWIEADNLWIRNDLYVMKFSAKKDSKKYFSEVSNRNKEIELMFDLIQQLRLHFFNQDLVTFKKEAEVFLATNKTAAISEEQRKLIVQSNTLNEEKNYSGAIHRYNSVIELNKFSYPQAYYNMALIAGIQKNYEYAILNMKKYLILEPNATDARAAQDKIYEWELKTEKQ